MSQPQQHGLPNGPGGPGAPDLRTVALGDFNIDPAVWGPPLWASVHTLALKADADSHEGLVAFKEFLNSLGFLLPCNNCRHEFNKYCSTHQPPEAGDCFGWTVRLHNYVNGRLGKPGAPIPEAAARELWTSRACNYNCSAGAAGGTAIVAHDGAVRSGSNGHTGRESLGFLSLVYILIGAVIVAVLYEIKIKRRYK